LLRKKSKKLLTRSSEEYTQFALDFSDVQKTFSCCEARKRFNPTPLGKPGLLTYLNAEANWPVFQISHNNCPRLFFGFQLAGEFTVTRFNYYIATDKIVTFREVLE
jgi:hypothetical protein